ncbi:MAG: gliding motility lipoprotein GldK [Muricauda sp.]|uniref:Gliding motility-associated lipoprotein GldK n=1 Tax=Flagellimonas lutaonensis TaxID=516051 RepID=A0A0D5YRW5_9FLAO|nr:MULTISPECIES: gliding motility lipoprotein GldK [Allomuricauda]AKA34601.1 Gliding motility-associated lipoprotein GldK [Allomuricauda lutaonensis]MAU26899.1 gliding motility lipoprotein GldK [Allomuricauda sp.]MBC30621.1 gliding motility lipoprotein GldK [Allomuricauda sp.]|tara:strand:+ start:16799 stop:18172 length:1374 start_codon:yes stop_codon:yes gene_type:complete
MRKLLLPSLALVFLLASCGSKSRSKGELVGVKGKKWHPEKPYGMELIPRGAFVMGKADEDQAKVMNAPTRTVTVRSFYMDDTEITNSEYRQFVEWVKDSVARTRLAILADELGLGPEDEGIGEYAFKDTDTTDLSVYEKYMLDNYAGLGETGYEGRALNKDVDLVWDTSDYPDEYYAEIMDSLYLPEEESYNGQRTFDVTKLKYKYTWMDIEAAARAKSGKRSDFIKKEELEIYPDTTVWIRDFEYSYNEPMHNDYFWHDAYSDYPVVGVNWKQAKAFCHWRTKFKNDDQKSRGKQFVNQFRLPTEAEWEYAARGGIEGGTYPWGGPYVISDTGCFMANFKPQRGDYAADAALYTVEAKSFEPNDYNLYNMAGNVSEWTNSSYDPGAYQFVSTMNPNAGSGQNERKVIRGGSWKDVAYFLQVSTRDYEYQDSARSYIGFRTVQDYMGEEDSTRGNGL